MNDLNGLDWLAEYQSNVRPLVQKHGGRYVEMSRGFDGQHIQCVEGKETVPDATMLLSFPSIGEAINLLNPVEYKPYRRMPNAETQNFAFAFEE